MKKTKKFLALLTALSISASAFVSAVPAFAAENAISYADGKITITYDTDEATPATLIFARYDGGKLIEASVEAVTLEEDGETEVPKTLYTGTKIMLWNAVTGTGSMVPLVDEPFTVVEGETPPVVTDTPTF